MGQDQDTNTDPGSQLPADDTDYSPLEASASYVDPNELYGGQGALTKAQRAEVGKEAKALRGEGDKEYDTALSQQQKLAQQARDALRSARDRLTNEQPDRSPMWLSIAQAMGAPHRGWGGFADEITEGMGAAAPYKERERVERLNRLTNIDALNTQLSEYGNDKEAFSPDLIQSRLAQARLRQVQASALEVAALRHSGAAGAGGASTPLGKLLAERDGLAPDDPERKLYDRQIALLQKTTGGTGEVVTPGNTALSGEEYLATLPESMRGVVKAISDGRQQMPSSRSALMKDPYQRQVMAALEHYDPEFDFANAGARAATYKSFKSGADSDNIKTIGTAIHHLFNLKASYDKLNNTRFGTYNSVANAAGTMFGNQTIQANVAGVETDARAVAHELAGVFRKAGMSEAEINDWQKSITSAATPAESNTIIQHALDLMNGRLYELAEKYNRGMHQKVSDPIDMLAPQDRALYQQLTGGAPPEGLRIPGTRAGASGAWQSGQPPTGVAPGWKVTVVKPGGS